MPKEKRKFELWKKNSIALISIDDHPSENDKKLNVLGYRFESHYWLQMWQGKALTSHICSSCQICIFLSGHWTLELNTRGHFGSAFKNHWTNVWHLKSAGMIPLMDVIVHCRQHNNTLISVGKAICIYIWNDMNTEENVSLPYIVHAIIRHIL